MSLDGNLYSAWQLSEVELKRFKSDKLYAEGQARDVTLEMEAIRTSQDQVRKI